MELKTGKEMDRKCVFDWLNEVYFSPSVSYSKYTDEKIRMFAHDALVLLKGQEAKTAHWIFGNTMGHSWMKCSKCCVSQSGQTGCWTYCPNCGAEMKGDTEVEID